jgi:hypothetical protein
LLSKGWLLIEEKRGHYIKKARDFFERFTERIPGMIFVYKKRATPMAAKPLRESKEDKRNGDPFKIKASPRDFPR